MHSDKCITLYNHLVSLKTINMGMLLIKHQDGKNFKQRNTSLAKIMSRAIQAIVC